MPAEVAILRPEPARPDRRRLGLVALQGQTVGRPAAVNAARTRAIWLRVGGVTSAQG